MKLAKHNNNVRTAQLFFFLILAITIASCKKSNNLIAVSSLNVINAASGIANAQVRTPNVMGYYNQLTGVNYGKNQVFTLPAGSSLIAINSKADTVGKPLYSNTVSTSSGDIYSLFIGGGTGEDIVLNKDNIPYITDSSFGIRFINMSSNSSAVHAALTTSPATDEFTGIAYKSITGFKSYSAKSTDPTNYQFQVMDASNNVLATSPNISRATLLQHNAILVFSGLIGGSGTDTPKLFMINNY